MATNINPSDLIGIARSKLRSLKEVFEFNHNATPPSAAIRALRLLSQLEAICAHLDSHARLTMQPNNYNVEIRIITDCIDAIVLISESECGGIYQQASKIIQHIVSALNMLEGYVCQPTTD